MRRAHRRARTGDGTGTRVAGPERGGHRLIQKSKQERRTRLTPLGKVPEDDAVFRPALSKYDLLVEDEEEAVAEGIDETAL